MEFIELLKIIFLGIVEGITEWLPISSTGHMILVDEFLQLGMSDAFKEMFFVVIQLGAIMAVIVLFFQKLFPFSFSEKPSIDTDKINLWFKILVACIPAGVIGILFDDFLDEKFYNFQTVALMLIVYGILFIIVENRNKGHRPQINSLEDITYRTALIIGIFQVLALIPGTSRSGATIVGAMLIGTSRAIAAEFTFFLAIPVMVGASFLKLVKFGLVFSGGEFAALVIGMIVSFVVSVWAIKFLMSYIKKNDFKVFGWYRIILGFILLGYYFLALV